MHLEQGIIACVLHTIAFPDDRVDFLKTWLFLNDQSWTYLFSGLELFTVETVEQQGKEEVEHHKVTHHKGRQKDGKAWFGHSLKKSRGCVTCNA